MSAFISSTAPITAFARSTRSVTPLRRPHDVLRRTLRATADLPTNLPTETDLTEEPPAIATGNNCRVLLDGKQIAYDYFPGTGPTIVFLPGFFDSRFKQSQASALEIFAKRKGQAVLVGEYLGIGRSEGDFVKDGTLARWMRDTIGLLDHVVGDGKVVLVGAGIGGWIMLHVAIRVPHRVVGLVGINPSVDFTEDLVVPKMTVEQREELETSGKVDMNWGYTNYPIGKAFVEDAKKWLVLRGEEGGLDITCPVRLIQGLNDEELPAERVLKLVERLQSEDVVLQFVKYGDHMMDSEEDLRRIWSAVCEVSDNYYEFDLTSPTSG